MPESILKECLRHGTTKHYKRSDGGHRCSKCNTERTSEARRRLKQKLVEAFGGKCQRCEYDKCTKALQFHHLDKGLKTFTIGSGKYKSWDRCLVEAKKCAMLCANCHIEIEAQLFEDSLACLGLRQRKPKCWFDSNPRS